MKSPFKWQCYQKLRRNFHARPEKGRQIATEIIAGFPNCPIPEVARLGRSLRTWKAAILACFDTNGASNELTESVQRTSEETSCRIARGFRNFQNHRIDKPTRRRRRPPPLPE